MAVGGIQQSTKKGTMETAMPFLQLSPLPLLLPSPQLMPSLSSSDGSPRRRSCMRLVITIDDIGVDVIDVERLRSSIKKANILSQWNTLCVPTPAPATEPTALASVGGSHCGTPFHTLLCTFFEPCKIRDFPMPLLNRYTGGPTIGEKFPSIEVRKGNYLVISWCFCAKTYLPFFFLQLKFTLFTVSLYRPEPWAKSCPLFGVGVKWYLSFSRAVSHHSEFARTYVHRQ